MELSDTMHGIPMQTGRPSGVRSGDWLATFFIVYRFLERGNHPSTHRSDED